MKLPVRAYLNVRSGHKCGWLKPDSSEENAHLNLPVTIWIVADSISEWPLWLGVQLSKLVQEEKQKRQKQKNDKAN